MNKKKFVTRFAPSPTGMLHIGGARTALFNYLLAKHHNGTFCLRIEDTDKARSTLENRDAIINSLRWLDINWDGDIIFQSKRINRHKEIAMELLKAGKAYYCFTAQEEINQMREKAIQEKKHFIFHSPWRDTRPENYPKDVKPVIRLKTTSVGQTIVKDLLQGDVVTENDHLDDMILLRADGTPTYMLAVVVDDHDMGVTHIIRGDDHLNNAARQQLIYYALDWQIPQMVHIPLIHSEDGIKLSKRTNAMSIKEYCDMGYLPHGLCNYLLRLGWSHGDDEFITRKQAIELFDINGLSKSPARLDLKKMNHVNAHYLRQMEGRDLLEKIMSLSAKRNNSDNDAAYQNDMSFLSAESRQNILKGMDSIKARSELIRDACDLAMLYQIDIPIIVPDELLQKLDANDRIIVDAVVQKLQNTENITEDNIKTICKEIADEHNIQLGAIMKPIRILMTGQEKSPSIFELIAIIGKKASLERLTRQICNID